MAGFNAGDFERASAAFRDDYEHHFALGFTESVLRGRDAWRAFFEDFFDTLEDWSVTAVEYVEISENLFVVEVDTRGFGRASGLPASVTMWEVCDVDDQLRPWRTREFVNRADAFAAASGG